MLRGRTARAAEQRRVRLDDGAQVDADALFVATGKHEMRGCARPVAGRALSAGLRAAVDPSPDLARALAGVIELHLYDCGYAGLLLQEDGRANLCLSVAQARLGEGRDAWLAGMAARAPMLVERLDGALPEAWDAIAGVPYGWRAGTTTAGVYRIGDQAAVIASLAGDGIAMALAGGAAAAQACLHGDGTGARVWQQDFARRAARPVRVAEALRHMAEHRGGRGLMMRLARIGGLAGLAARLTRIG